MQGDAVSRGFTLCHKCYSDRSLGRRQARGFTLPSMVRRRHVWSDFLRAAAKRRTGIVASYAAIGAPATAELYGVSRQRVLQIVREERLKRAEAEAGPPSG